MAGTALSVATASQAIALAQSPNGETSGLARRQHTAIEGEGSFVDLSVLMPFDIVPNELGCVFTIKSDRSLRGYSSRHIGEWFEVRIFNADARKVERNFSGAGLQSGRVVQSGSDAVFLFRLEKNHKAIVTREGDGIAVNFFSAAGLAATVNAPVKATPSSSAENLDLPRLRKIVLESAAVAPPVAVVSAEVLLATTVMRSEAPPPPPRLVQPGLPRLRTQLILSNAITPPVPASLREVLGTPLVVETDAPPPPPPKSSGVRSGSEPTEVTNDTATTPKENGSGKLASDAETAPSSVSVEDSPDKEPISPPPIDPNKPAPATISLPQGPAPQPRSRAPLSQERRFELTGVISLDYSKTNQTGTPEGVNFGEPIKNRAHNFGVGLDLHFGTFMIDPRFLKLSFDSGFTTTRGAFDELTTRQGNKGASLYIDFLPTSPYPFRFHYTRRNTHLLEQQIASASSGRSSLGFDWYLRKPNLPNLSINFEDNDYTSRFIASSSFKSQSKTLSISVNDNVKGWDINSNFNRQTGTEGVTDLKTNLNFLRFDARRQLSKKANLFVSSFFEKLRFDSPRTKLGQDFSLFEVHSDLAVQPTKKLSLRAAHQFYYSGDDQIAEPTDGATVHNVVPSPPSPKSVTSFQAVHGQVNYRVWPSLSVVGSGSARFIRTPQIQSESVKRFVDLTAGVSWNKRLGFTETRASFVEGLTQVASNSGAEHAVHFRTYSAGLSMGTVGRALVTLDFNATSRPDTFLRGGFYSQKNFSASLETRAISRFQIRGSLGANAIDYVTASGREHLRTTTYSMSVDDKWFTVLLNHNANRGVRDVFLVPITINDARVFRVLPVDSLIREPLLNASGGFTLALARFKPRNGLDFEVRYLKDRAIFARTNDVFTQQFDVLARYKVGKVTLTSGLIFFTQETERLFRRDRNYFFVRLSRPFTLF